MTKTAIDLPFTPEDVREGRVGRAADKNKREGAAWDRVRANDDLADVRRKLSIDDMRRLIRVIIE